MDQPLDYGTYWPFDDNDSVRRFGALMQALKASPDGGVAFLGAGASAPAGFPPWKQFHSDFLTHFEAEPATDSGDPFWTLLGDIDYHTDRDQSGAIRFVKEAYARSVVQIPDVVSLVRRTRSLQRYYTTNFDEILFQAAQGQAVAAYPTYEPPEARFVYMHGRASTASTIHQDLVLGTSGYRKAYYQEEGAVAKAKLQMLAQYPVVFIGFSMDDLMVRRSVEDIASGARRREGRSDGAPAVDAGSPLKWYILRRAPKRADLLREEEKRRKEAVLRDSALQIIWYQDGQEGDRHRGLMEIIHLIHRESRGLMLKEEEPGFVERLNAAEELGSVSSPTSNHVGRAEAVLRDHPKVASAFWSRVDGLGWFRSLREVGALNPPEVTFAATGERRAPPWMAVGLLRRLAAVASPEVVEFFRTVDTDNWSAAFGALQVLKELDDASGAVVAPQIARWTVQALTVDSSLLLALSETVRDLNSNGKEASAFALARAMLTELEPADPTLEEWKAKNLVESVVPTLVRSDGGLELAVERLRASLERRYETPEQDDVRRVRPAIEDHRVNLRERSSLDVLIELVRDLLLATEEAERRSTAVASLLQSEWPTERRIGIAHCFLHPVDFPTHLERVISPENLANRHLFHEMAKLLDEHMDALGDSATQTLSDFLASLSGEEELASRVEYARWSKVVPYSLLPSSLAESDEGSDSEARLFPDLYVGEVFHPDAPLDSQNFAERAEGLTHDALLALVRDPAGAGVPVTWRHDTEQMWTRFADYATEREDIDLLLEITAEDLNGNSSWRAIDAMPKLAGNETEAWERVLDWAHRMVSSAPSEALWSMGRLLREGGKSAPLELNSRIVDLALQVNEMAKRTAFADEALAEDSLRGGFVNSPAGMAMEALFEVVRRQVTEAEAAGGHVESIPLWFKESVLEPMAAAPLRLGIDAWIGLGLVYSVLSAREPAALRFVNSHLTTQPEVIPTTALAFWTGYLWTPGVFSDSLNELRDAYRTSAPILQGAVLEEELRDMFLHHLVIGAVREVPGYDDIVLATLDATFTPESRGAIAFSFGRGVEEAAGEGGEPFRTVANDWFLRYWTEHVATLGGQDGGQDGGQLGQYLYWLNFLGAPPSQIGRLVEVSVEHAEEYLAVDKTVEYLGTHVETEPAATLQLLASCVDWYRGQGYCWLEAAVVHALLDRLAPLTSGDVVLSEVLDGLAEVGVLSPQDVQRYLSPGGA